MAHQLGKKLKGGEIIELVSDLGGGKTTFVRGIVAGMGSSEHVNSPSFTLSNEYTAGDLTVHHYDFYRLHEPGILRDELQDVMQDPNAVVIIEWADIVADVIEGKQLRIDIEVTGEYSRRYTFSASETLDYLSK